MPKRPGVSLEYRNIFYCIAIQQKKKQKTKQNGSAGPSSFIRSIINFANILFSKSTFSPFKRSLPFTPQEWTVDTWTVPYFACFEKVQLLPVLIVSLWMLCFKLWFNDICAGGKEGTIGKHTVVFAQNRAPVLSALCIVSQAWSTMKIQWRYNTNSTYYIITCLFILLFFITNLLECMVVIPSLFCHVSITFPSLQLIYMTLPTPLYWQLLTK